VHRFLGEQQEDRDPDSATATRLAVVAVPTIMPLGASSRVPAERASTPASWAICRAGAFPEVVVAVLAVWVMREAVRGVIVPVHDSILS